MSSAATRVLLLTVLGCCFVACSGDNNQTGKSNDPAVDQPIAADVADAQTDEIANTDSSPKTVSVAAEIDPEKAYRPCAACHLKTGKGVPGAFPPLEKNVMSLTQSKEGRAFLVQSVFYGLNGEITVSGEIYNGVMPPQGGMTSAKASAILNYIMTDINFVSEANFQKFSDDEIEKILDESGRQSAQEIASSRPQIQDQ